MTTPLVIIGAGAHCHDVLVVVRTVNEVEPQFDFLGFVDDGDLERPDGGKPDGGILGSSDRIGELGAVFLTGIGDCGARRRYDQVGRDAGWVSPSLVDPQTTVLGHAQLGPGTVCSVGSRVSTGVRVGRHVFLHYNCTIGHDAKVEDYVMVASGAHIGAEATIGNGTWVGVGATVATGVTVGERVVVGMGAVVTHDVESGVTVTGVPARVTGPSAPPAG